jgi:hypothetical protein
MLASIELQNLKKAMAESPPDPVMPKLKVSKLSIQSEDRLNKTIQLFPSDPSKVTHVRSNLDLKLELTLIKFLQENRDIFTWKPLTCLEFLGN